MFQWICIALKQVSWLILFCSDFLVSRSHTFDDAVYLSFSFFVAVVVSLLFHFKLFLSLTFINFMSVCCSLSITPVSTCCSLISIRRHWIYSSLFLYLCLPLSCSFSNSSLAWCNFLSFLKCFLAASGQCDYYEGFCWSFNPTGNLHNSISSLIERFLFVSVSFMDN